jgi:transcriptional regulator with XRE-family HTH domain
MTGMADESRDEQTRDQAVDKLLKELPSRIARERKRSNLNVPAAAGKAGLEPGYWRKLETGKVTTPGIRNLLLVQYALGLESLEALFGVPSGRRLSG